MQSLAATSQQPPETQFYRVLQEISQNLTTFFLERVSKGLPTESLLSRRRLEAIDVNIHPVVQKLHCLVYAQLEELGQKESITDFVEQQYYLIPLEHLERITKTAADLKSLAPRCWDQLSLPPAPTKHIPEFVQAFNEQFIDLPNWRAEAQQIIESLEADCFSCICAMIPLSKNTRWTP